MACFVLFQIIFQLSNNSVLNSMIVAIILLSVQQFLQYSETCLKQPLKNRQNKDLNDNW